MSAFTTTTLTTKGIDVMSRLVAGDTLEFTAVKVGDGALGSKNPMTLTALIHTIDTLGINDVRVTSAGVATVQATFTNQGKSTGFFYRELGLFCKDPTTKKEVLFAYGNAGNDAEWIPPAGEATVVEKIVSLETLIGNAAKVSATLLSGIYVTTTQLDATLASYATKTNLSDGLAPKADDSAVVHKAGTETVTGAKTFSAKITATGGVQGNVTGNLTGTASKATADASGNTITSTYATKTENAAKATDSAVVHLAGTETVTGAKTFNAAQTWKASNTYAGNTTKGDAPSKNNNMFITRTDTSGEVLQSILFGHMTNNRSRVSLQASDCSGDTDTVAELNIYNVSGTTYATCPTPEDAANDTKIATTAWARKNCVDLTSVQTITGNKYFSGGLFKKLDGVDVTTTPATNQYSFFDFNDKNNKLLARYQYCARAAGGHDLAIGVIKDSTAAGNFLTMSDTGYIKWCNNDILTTVNGVDLTSAQSITGIKTYKSDGLYFTGDTVYLNGPTFKHTKFNKNDTITTQIFDVIRFGGADYANTYATTIGEIRQTRYADSDALYSGHNSIDIRISSNANTSASSMKALQLYSTGSMQWCGKDVLTTGNGVDLASAQTITGAKTFNSSILANTGGAPALKTTAEYGAELYMWPSSNTTYKGGIILRARGEDGSFKDLYIRSDGSLTWNGKNVLTAANGVDLSNNQTINGQKKFTSGIVANNINRGITNSQLQICGGTDLNNGGALIVYGASDAEPGSAKLRAAKSASNYVDLVALPTGQLTWNNKNIVRSINGVSADTSGNVKYSDVVASGTGYIKYSDGTQICYGEAMHMGTTNFPMPFVSKPYVTATHQTGDTNTPAFCITRNTTATSFIMLVRNTSGGVWATGAYGEYIAIGKWK